MASNTNTSSIPLPDDLIGLAEACKLMPSRKPGRRLHCVTVYRWITRGKIQGWRIGGHWFVSKAQLLDMARPSVPLPEVATRNQRLREIAAAREAYYAGRKPRTG